MDSFPAVRLREAGETDRMRMRDKMVHEGLLPIFGIGLTSRKRPIDRFQVPNWVAKGQELSVIQRGNGDAIVHKGRAGCVEKYAYGFDQHVRWHHLFNAGEIPLT